MSHEWRHESADLEDYQVLDASDTLDGAPGDDPLDRGVITPDRWSAAIRFGTTATEQQSGESLGQALAEEEPDVIFDISDAREEGIGPDENATDEDVASYLLDDGPDPRAGRLVDEDAEIYGEADNYLLLMMIVSLTTSGPTAAGRPRRRQPSTSWTPTPRTS